MKAGVSFFFKQMGGEGRDKGGDLLDGVRQKEFPDVEVEAPTQTEQLTMSFDRLAPGARSEVFWSGIVRMVAIATGIKPTNSQS
jgi:hypothetical protein